MHNLVESLIERDIVEREREKENFLNPYLLDELPYLQPQLALKGVKI